jgi:uncharacterized protein YdhG (YjbR/CyaY superfamily)
MTTKKANEIDKYISGFPKETQKLLRQMRETIMKACPEAEEIIAYKMPAYKFHGVLVYFAGYDKHIGFYSTPTGHKEFEKEFSKYKTGKGSVQFPLDQPLPLPMITKVVKFRMKENLQKESLKKKK